jgi:polyphenol oxidase
MDLIKPAIFHQERTIEAVFTASSRENSNSKGVNFGINTGAEKSVITKNYRTLFQELGWDLDKIALARQVHGSRIALVDQPGIYEETDGLITTTLGLPLGIQVADCAAILVADTEANVVGAFHAGWRGAVDEIIPDGIEKMAAQNAHPERCKAYISPCISQKHFEVGEEVAAKFPDEFCDRKNFKKTHVNLKRFIVHQLKMSGLLLGNIEVSDGCTFENDRFFSYRRERESAGRMLGVIKIKP